MLRLPDHWVWDSWPVRTDDGETHLFFLRASRALLDPERRHRRASVGHARSRDLTEWELLPDALVAADEPSFDDGSIWTGSVVRGDDGLWRLFYTGASRREDWLIQRVGVATSEDLISWHRQEGPVLEADARWYERLDLDVWHDEAWRDPWVFKGDDGLWHMLLTARVPDGDPLGRGVIGHATSTDLVAWEAQPPLSAPAGWGQLEVPQTVVVDGQPFLIFCCGPDHQDSRRNVQATGGMWFAPGESLLGPWDFDAAGTFDHPSLYAARLVERQPGEWFLVGFSGDVDGVFEGLITDPLPIERVGRSLRLARS
ncbi:MAG: glycoside hydrolase family 68 protein [Propionibacteriaceae bacterium]|nr:glycoside hydrolase family 68 protein [Propionibacteriaceae bacterium]